MIAAQAVRRQRFQHPPGDIGAGGVEHGVVVGEGNLAQELPVVVGVESRPAAIARLHGEQPVERAPLAGRCARRVRARLAERQHHHGGVVDIRIKLVAYSKAQPEGSVPGRFTAPVALAADLALQQPIRGARQRRAMPRIALPSA
jgi:hypothetical protein